jgi:glycosyltransferase
MIIITVTKNSASTIKDTIKSIKDQSIKNLFWWVFDDKSTDLTVDIIKKSQIPNKIFYTNSISIYEALNSALRLIKKKKIKDIIFFLASDDVISSKHLLKNVDKIFKKYQVDLLYGNISFFKKNKNEKFRKWNAEFKEKQIKITNSIFRLKKISKKDLIKGWIFPHTSLFINSKIISNLNYYDTKYRISADYLWTLQLLLKNNLKIFFLNKNIINMRQGGVSTSFKNILNVFIEDWKILYNFYNKNFFYTIFTIFFKKIRKIKQFI